MANDTGQMTLTGSPVPGARETLIRPSGTLREQDWSHKGQVTKDK